MRGGDPLMVHADRDGLCGLEKTLGPVGELFEIHETNTSCRSGDSVAVMQHKDMDQFCSERQWSGFLNLALGRFPNVAVMLGGMAELQEVAAD